MLLIWCQHVDGVINDVDRPIALISKSKCNLHQTHLTLISDLRLIEPDRAHYHDLLHHLGAVCKWHHNVRDIPARVMFGTHQDTAIMQRVFGEPIGRIQAHGHAAKRIVPTQRRHTRPAVLVCINQRAFLCHQILIPCRIFAFRILDGGQMECAYHSGQLDVTANLVTLLVHISGTVVLCQRIPILAIVTVASAMAAVSVLAALSDGETMGLHAFRDDFHDS